MTTYGQFVIIGVVGTCLAFWCSANKITSTTLFKKAKKIYVKRKD